MINLPNTLKKFFLFTVAACSLALISTQASAISEEELNKNAQASLQALYASNPAADAISKKARAILVFPSIIKAGLVFGGAYGEGILTKEGHFSGFYNTVSASWGW